MNTSESLQTTVLATVEPQSLNSVLSELHNLQGVTFYTPSAGRFDLVIWLNTIEQAKVYALVNQIRAMEGVVSTRTLIPFNGFANGRNFKQAHDSVATVLLGVNGQTQSVVKALEQLPNVYSAYVTPGEFDVVATIMTLRTVQPHRERSRSYNPASAIGRRMASAITWALPVPCMVS